MRRGPPSRPTIAAPGTMVSISRRASSRSTSPRPAGAQAFRGPACPRYDQGTRRRSRTACSPDRGPAARHHADAQPGGAWRAALLGPYGACADEQDVGQCPGPREQGRVGVVASPPARPRRRWSRRRWRSSSPSPRPVVVPGATGVAQDSSRLTSASGAGCRRCRRADTARCWARVDKAPFVHTLAMRKFTWLSPSPRRAAPLGWYSVPAAVRHRERGRASSGLGSFGARALNLRCRTAWPIAGHVDPGQRHLFGGVRDSIDRLIITVV